MSVFAAATTAQSAGDANLSIAWAGDVALLGTPSSSLFSHVAPTLRSADLAIGNLEGTLGSAGTSKCGNNSSNCFAFQSPVSSAALFRAAGFDDLNVANNHAFDYGAAGQRSTLHALALQHLRWSGRPHQITALTANGIRVAILGFAPYPWASRLTNIPGAVRLVTKATAQADLVVCVLHAGAEGTAYQHVGSSTEYYLGENRGNARAFAHAVIEAGADLVVASGPHVLRGMEYFQGRLIAYSLGNFATAGHGLSTDGILGDSGILQVTLTAGGDLVSGRFVPVRIAESGEPHLVSGGSIIPRLNALSREDFHKTAVRILASGVLQH